MRLTCLRQKLLREFRWVRHVTQTRKTNFWYDIAVGRTQEEKPQGRSAGRWIHVFSFFLPFFLSLAPLRGNSFPLIAQFLDLSQAVGLLGWVISLSYTVHCTDEQHAMSSHKLQSALMLTMEFSEMLY
jgi:hypothetical protein